MKIVKLLLVFCLPAMLFAGELQFLVTGDIHGRMADFSRLAPVIRSYPEAVKIDLGDTFHGDVCNDLLNGEPMIEALNSLGYHIWVPGNHEFELPGKIFLRTAARFSGKILGNWQVAGKTFPNWTMIEKNGIRCAVIGMTECGMYGKQELFPDYRLFEELKCLDEVLENIAPYRPDAVVLARHGGNYFRGMSAGKVLYDHPEIAVMLCAHSHREIAGERSGRALIVQPGPFAQTAVLVTIIKSPSRRGVQVRSRLLRPGTAADMEVSAIRKRAVEKCAAALKEKVRPEDLSRDALAERMLQRMCESTGADAALFDCPDVPFFKNSRFDHLRRFPYRNFLCVIRVNGSELSALKKEKAPRRHRRYVSAVRGSREKYTLVLSAFQLRRSKVLAGRDDFRVTGIVERDLLIWE